ncbi:MAG: response regulator [Bacillota bacterium]
MTSVRGARVLVVDDERPVRRFLDATLGGHGWEVTLAETGREAIMQLSSSKFDAVILDLSLPDMDGKEVIEQVREWSQTPIIIVSARDQEMEKVAALDAGADDYLTKPFGTAELLARLRVAIRHSPAAPVETAFRIGGLEVDLPSHTVTVDGERVSLTPIEYDLLREFCQNAGKVLTHRHLLTRVWGPAYERETHLLQVNVSNLRRKIESNPTEPRYILTEPGVGYRLELPDS